MDKILREEEEEENNKEAERTKMQEEDKSGQRRRLHEMLHPAIDWHAEDGDGREDCKNTVRIHEAHSEFGKGRHP